MDKTERIREDCRVLMSGEDGSTKAGWVRDTSLNPYAHLFHFVWRLEIMASTSSNLEQGYEKLLRYCSNEFRQIGRDFQLEVSNGLREAVVRLRKRPELLTSVIYKYIPTFLTYKPDMQWGLNLPIGNASGYRSLVLYHRSHSWRTFWISPPHRTPRPRSNAIRWRHACLGTPIYSRRTWISWKSIRIEGWWTDGW